MINKCFDCEKTLKDKRSKRCRSCESKRNNYKSVVGYWTGKKRNVFWLREVNVGKIGDLSASWKDMEAKYRAKHMWIQARKGKASYCSFDKSHIATRYHWANISGNYLRDVDDYASLCPTCHKQYDMIRSGKGGEYHSSVIR